MKIDDIEAGYEIVKEGRVVQGDKLYVRDEDVFKDADEDHIGGLVSCFLRVIRRKARKAELIDIDKVEEFPFTGEIPDRRFPLTMEKPVETMTHRFPPLRSNTCDYNVVSGDCDHCDRCKDDPQYCEVCTSYHFNETWVRK